MMSFWDHMFDSEWKQRSDIEELKKASRYRRFSSRRQAGEHEEQIKSLEHRIDELEDDLGQATLFLMATMEMLKQTDNWDNDKFHSALAIIDKRDGVQDGKATLDG